MESLHGKTYSLYGESNSSDGYFTTIKKVTDLWLQSGEFDDPGKLLSYIREISKAKHPLKKLPGEKVETLKEPLSIYTKGVKDHLRRLSIFKRFDRVLKTTEGQYYLYMMEIELVNRVYVDSFNRCQYKFALLPHCLRDFRLRCLYTPGNIDYICKGCTKECRINQGSTVLKQAGIDPYISVAMDQDRLLKEVKEKYGSVGVLGIACIPELAMGMRLAISLGIPPIGVPLDVNRCSRWMGKAHETTFNLKELERLVL